MKKKTAFKTIDEYISMFAPEIKKKLENLRKVIQAAVPEAQEKISYQMPAYDYLGNLVYFAAYKKHIGFYPTPSGIDAFTEELAAYKKTKGAVQFLLNEPLPYDLITKIVQYRAEENMRKNDEKGRKKKKNQE